MTEIISIGLAAGIQEMAAFNKKDFKAVKEIRLLELQLVAMLAKRFSCRRRGYRRRSPLNKLTQSKLVVFELFDCWKFFGKLGDRKSLFLGTLSAATL